MNKFCYEILKMKITQGAEASNGKMHQASPKEMQNLEKMLLE